MCEISWVCAVLSVSTALRTSQIKTRCSSHSYTHTLTHSYSFTKVFENSLKTPSTWSSKTSTAYQTHELTKHELIVTFIQSTVLPAEIWPMRSIRRATRVDQVMTDLQKRDVCHKHWQHTRNQQNEEQNLTFTLKRLSPASVTLSLALDSLVSWWKHSTKVFSIWRRREEQSGWVCFTLSSRTEAKHTETWRHKLNQRLMSQKTAIHQCVCQLSLFELKYFLHTVHRRFKFIFQ